MEKGGLNKSILVSEFMTTTCEIHPVPNMALQHVVWRRLFIEDGQIHTLTGSTAEFYITPAISCIGDFDVMVYQEGFVALPDGGVSSTKFMNSLNLYKDLYFAMCEDKYKCPGYVNLCYAHRDGRKAKSGDDVEYFTHQFLEDSRRHGPAAQFVEDRFFDQYIRWYFKPELDNVFCVHCPIWPPIASAWPIRFREFEWPSKSIVENVINQGCDVVPSTHRDYRPNYIQWRYSFSRAEVVLLNSWTPKQQLAYHMIRFIIKKDTILSRSLNTFTDELPLSNYHLKTVMMWACEKHSQVWWNMTDLVCLCSELLYNLIRCLENKNCPNYFIPKCNLFGHRMADVQVQLTVRRLRELMNTRVLADWFMSNYLLNAMRGAGLVSDAMTRKLKSDELSQLWTTGVQQFYKWKILHTKENRGFDITFCISQLRSCFEYFYLKTKYSRNWRERQENRFTERSYLQCVGEFLNIDTRLTEYIWSIFVLHIATNMSRDSVRRGKPFRELTSLMTAMFSKSLSRCTSCPLSTNEHECSSLYFDRALFLVKCLKKQTTTADVQILIDLSKQCLYEALRYQDSYRDSIYCVANVYLAVLHYTTGHYQISVDHCNLVTSRKTHSHCGIHVDQKELLPSYDDMDILGGFFLLYKHQIRHILQRLTVSSCNCLSIFFAHYLKSKSILQQHVHHSLRCQYSNLEQHNQFQKNINEGRSGLNNTTELIDMLVESAGFHLMTFQHSIKQDGFISASTSEFQTVHLYYKGHYKLALTACEEFLENYEKQWENARTAAKRPSHYDFTNNFLFSGAQPTWLGMSFLVFVDDDIRCWIGLMCLCNHLIDLKFGSSFCVQSFTLLIYIHLKCLLILATSRFKIMSDVKYISELLNHRGALHYKLNLFDFMLLSIVEERAFRFLGRRNWKKLQNPDNIRQDIGFYHLFVFIYSKRHSADKNKLSKLNYMWGLKPS